jgi:hypothetical protein
MKGVTPIHCSNESIGVVDMKFQYFCVIFGSGNWYLGSSHFLGVIFLNIEERGRQDRRNGGGRRERNITLGGCTPNRI